MSEDGTTRLLVVANETVVGKPLIDAVKARADKGKVEVHVICPQNQPRAGWVGYGEEARWAAENRLKATLARLNEAGIHATGAIEDPDPYTAIMDELGPAAPRPVRAGQAGHPASGRARGRGRPQRRAWQGDARGCLLERRRPP